MPASVNSFTHIEKFYGRETEPGVFRSGLNFTRNLIDTISETAVTHTSRGQRFKCLRGPVWVELSRSRTTRYR